MLPICNLLGESYPGGQGLVRRTLELKGVPREAVEISASSITDSSYKQCESTFKRWWKFGLTRKISPFAEDVDNILVFLPELYQGGASQSTLN
ncbi:hypothetical protein TKK_0013567 [Trichogramma kaykai]